MKKKLKKGFMRLVKALRSNLSFTSLHCRYRDFRLPDCGLAAESASQSVFTDCETRLVPPTKLCPFAFTLAEVIVTLTILGVVAALTVPSIVHNNQTRINKTRLKKAMATYDKAISQMSVVNRLNNKVLFKQWAKENDCDNAVSYFNIVNSTRNGCKFKTSDGIWWDVSEIDRTLVSFKEQNLTLQKAKDYDDKDAFVLVTSFDDSQGVLRIDDLGYETNNPINYSDVYVAKLYNMLGKASEFSEFKKCGAKGQTTCTITVDGKSYTYRKVSLTDTTICNLHKYDRENRTTDINYCSLSIVKDVYISFEGTLTEKEATDAYSESSVCKSSACRTNGDYYEAAKNKCESQGASLASVAELKSLANQGLLSSGNYFSALEYNKNTIYTVNNAGSVYDNKNEEGFGKGYSGRKVLCLK